MSSRPFNVSTATRSFCSNCLQLFFLPSHQLNDNTIAFFAIELTGHKAACCSARWRALKNYLLA
jgi:hypothetical protein